jgi:hypothetical protein
VQCVWPGKKGIDHGCQEGRSRQIQWQDSNGGIGWVSELNDAQPVSWQHDRPDIFAKDKLTDGFE